MNGIALPVSIGRWPMVCVCLWVTLTTVCSQETPAVEAAGLEQAAEAAAETGHPEPLEDDWLAFLTTGIWAGENYFEGRVDALIPLFSCARGDGRMFLDLRGAWADEGQQELNLGVVLRRRCLPNDGIFGLNTYYDSRWTRYGSHFSQWGLGAEILTEWVDMRANYYLPEHKQSHIGRTESVALSGAQYEMDYRQYATDNQLREGWTRMLAETWQRDVIDRYEYPLKGYDAEIGIKLPGSFHDAVEARVFLGYYQFEHRSPARYNSGKGEIAGLKGRFEVRGWNKLFFDVELFEDEDLYDTRFMVSARYRMPIGREGPVTGGVIDDRISEMVMRDPHIQLRTGVDHQQSVETTRKRVASGDALLLDDVIFVHGDRGGNPGADGTGQRPFGMIQTGVDAATEHGHQNVYVFGANAHYRESVVIESGLNLWGEGHRFGSTYPGLGIAPVVRGDPASGLPGAFNVFASDPVQISGFTFLGGTPMDGARHLAAKGGDDLAPKRPASVNPLLSPLVGVYALTSGDLIVQENTFKNLLAGVFAMQHEASNVAVVDNRFENVGAGVVSMGSDAAATLVAGNTIEHALAGVIALGQGSGTEYTVQIVDNAIRGNTSDIGGYVDPVFLATMLGHDEAFDAFGMEVPDAWPMPSIAGIVVGSMGAARVDALVADNTVDGSLLGVLGFSAGFGGPKPTELNMEIVGNTLVGGGADPLYQLARAHAGSLAGLFLGMGRVPKISEPDPVVELGTFLRELLPETLGTDFGLSGITLAAIGQDGEIASATLADNTISDYVLGMGAVALGGGTIDQAVVVGNTFSDTFVGALGLALSDSSIHQIGFYENTFQIGGTDKLNDILRFDGDRPIPNGGVLGIGVGAIGQDARIGDVGIADNAISGALAGILALAADEGEIGSVGVFENRLTDNLIGGAAVALGEHSEIQLVGFYDNVITGGGSAALLGLIDSFTGGLLTDTLDFDPTAAPDMGLMGLGLFARDGGDIWISDVIGNEIDRTAIGVGLMAYSHGASSSIDDSWILDNSIDNAWAGILGIATGGSIDRFDIADNTISASRDDVLRDLAFSILGNRLGLDADTFPGLMGIALFAGDDGRFEDGKIRRNAIDGFLWGIVANANGPRSSLDGLAIRQNTLTDNVIGIQTSGQSGASLDEVVIRNNTIDGGTIGILAAIAEDASGPVSFMDVRIRDNVISGSGEHFGLAFYGLGAFSEWVTRSDALHPVDVFHLDGMDDFPDDLVAILPAALHDDAAGACELWDVFDVNTTTRNGFAGIVTSFNAVDGGRAVIRDNTVSGFRNGIFVAGNGSDNVTVRAIDNVSVRNRMVGGGFTLDESGAEQGAFTLLWP